MMKSKITPGTWNVLKHEDRPGTYTIEGVEDNAAEAYASDNPQSVAAVNAEDDANARAIAEVPAMIEALRELKTLMIYERDGWDGIEYTQAEKDRDIEQAIEKARAILARIEG